MYGPKLSGYPTSTTTRATVTQKAPPAVFRSSLMPGIVAAMVFAREVRRQRLGFIPAAGGCRLTAWPPQVGLLPPPADSRSGWHGRYGAVSRWSCWSLARLCCLFHRIEPLEGH